MTESMKKAFTLSLFSILAGGVALASLPSDATVVSALKNPVTRVATAADDEWEPIGEGEFSDPVICNEFANYYNDPVTVEVERNRENPAVYRILKPWGNISEVWPSVDLRPDCDYMIVDTSDPGYVLVREGALPFYDATNGEIRYQSMTQFAATRGFSREDFLASPLSNYIITMDENGYIEFPQNCFGIMYPEGVTETPGQWMPTMGSYSGYLVLPGGEAYDEWEHLGTGRMLDGFVWTVFEETAPQEKDVEIYESRDVPGKYKVEGAFTDSYELAADLIIDATDPDWVRIEKFDTRIQTYPYGPLYILSVSANNFLDYDDMINYDPAFAERNITLKDGIIDIPEKSVYLYMPEYDLATVMTNDLSIDSYIILPAYNGISAASDITGEAPAEYYNLQGVKVSNPAAGQIVIERRGDKVRKTVVR